MAVVNGFYSDPFITNMIKGFSNGRMSFQPNTYWTHTSSWTPLATIGDKKIYGNMINRDTNTWVPNAGGSILFDFNGSTQTRIDSYFDNPFTSDIKANNDSTAYTNYMFFYKSEEAGEGETQKKVSYYLRLMQSPTIRSIRLQVGAYMQDPYSPSESRETWKYEFTDTAQGGFTPQYVDSGFADNTQFGLVKVFNYIMDEVEYWAIVSGINNEGAFSNNYYATIILIPVDLITEHIPKPYVGPVTPESAAGFDPPGRGFYNDSIATRDITNLNPFGFNHNDGWGSINFIKQTDGEWKGLVGQIYHGYGEGWAGEWNDFLYVVGWQETYQRPADQVEAMTKGILSCRLIPDFGFPMGQKINESTICGYRLYKDQDTHLTIGNITDQIKGFEIGGTYVGRTYNNFLDFEPYTTATLHIPFVGNVNIDPSVLYGSTVTLKGYVDGFTGLISIDVCLSKDGTEWIYTELQGNCSVDMPIVGAGSTSSQALGKIASGVGQINSNPIGSVFSILDGLSSVGKAVPSTTNSNPQLASYFAQRYCYLTINTPLPENPSNYAALMGTVVRKEGTVGKYTGYSEFSAVNLSTVSATQAEKEEIERLLKGGVFV